MRKFLLIGLSTFALGAAAMASADQMTKPRNSETYKMLELFGDVLVTVKSQYVVPVDDKKLITYAISGMLSNLDPHSTYLDADAFKDLQVSTQGEFGGLGIEVGMEDGLIKVVSPIEDTPAYKAGIKAGDFIIKLDDTSVRGLTLADAVKRMRGKPKTPIRLTIVRKGEAKPFEITVIRDKIKVASIKSKLVDPGYGYVRITQFQEETTVDLVKALAKLTKDHGLTPEEFIVPDSSIRDLIRYYTRESGVRSLERELGNLARKTVRDLARENVLTITIDAERLAKYAGVRKYKYGEMDAEDQVGIITGLAYTDFGGDILTIEAVKMPGKGRMTVTGNLKDVMKESISAANSYVRSRATKFGLEPPSFERTDVHIHVPDGATPKDGPSAGAAMATAIVSVLTGIPIKKDIAMTGEVTLRGRVTAIGGLKEKLLAALRSGVKTVLIPSENEKDLADIPDNVKAEMTIIPVSTMDEVLAQALTRQPVAIEWSEANAPPVSVADDGDVESVLTH